MFPTNLRGLFGRKRKPQIGLRPKLTIDLPPERPPVVLTGWSEFVRAKMSAARTPAERKAAAREIMEFRREKLGY